MPVAFARLILGHVVPHLEKVAGVKHGVGHAEIKGVVFVDRVGVD